MLTEARLERLARGLRAASEASGADQQLPRGRRRAQGAFFTPPALVGFVVNAVLARRWEAGVAWDDDGAPALTVLDPSCGDGRFLVAARDWLVARSPRGPAAAPAIARRCLVGIERDRAFAEASRARLGGATIHCAEALLEPPPLAPADVVVGNPPYQRSIHLERTDPALWRALRGRYAATSHGEWDLYAAFLEQALAWLGPDGAAGLVVPSRWLTARFAGPLRARLAAAGAVCALVDFGAWQLFEGATTYASVAFLARDAAARVQVARWTEAGWSRGEVAARALDRAPWRLSVGARGRLVRTLAAAGPALGEVARIAKGTGTNADPVYVLADAELRGELVVGHSRALGETVAVEAALARPCARGRDIVGYGAVSGAVRLVYPYDDAGALMAELPPRAAAYLERCRDKLDARERGRFAGDAFYRFGRPQNLALLADRTPKLLVPDVARHGRALLDATGAIALDTVYAIRPHADAEVNIALLLDVLNSPIVRLWLAETGIPLRGGYLRLKTAYLASLPLPARREPGQPLADAYGVPAALWNAG